MFVVPALVSLSLDITIVVLYFQNQPTFNDRATTIIRLLDISNYNFIICALAALRTLFILPYIWSFVHRLRIIYTFIPWTWEVANVALVTARLVFLLSELTPLKLDYALVIMSYISVLLQAACFEHLRSSAPKEKHIFLMGGSVSRADASTRLLDPATHPNSAGELYDGHQHDMNFIKMVTAKMQRAKEYWTDKTEAMRSRWNEMNRSREESTAPFSLLLRLFTYEDVLGELDEAFVRDPMSIEFYIPQLVTFLLYGAFWSSASLQAFLLEKCSRSVQFAHHLYWFLSASCLHSGAGISGEGVRQVEALIGEVKSRGQVAARDLRDGRTPQELGLLGLRASTTPEARVSSHEHSKDDASASTFVDIGSLNSELSPAQRTSGSSKDRSSGYQTLSGPFPTSDVASLKGCEDDVFSVLPKFLEALGEVAQSLIPVPKEQRKDELRKKLAQVDKEFLPSNVIYMPIGNPYHRVWRIHCEESSAFSTKERVPCLVCLEVVEYLRPPKPEAKKKWWKMTDNVPAFSHTFRFGNKEWTFKIGDSRSRKASEDDSINNDGTGPPLSPGGLYTRARSRGGSVEYHMDPEVGSELVAPAKNDEDMQAVGLPASSSDGALASDPASSDRRLRVETAPMSALDLSGMGQWTIHSARSLSQNAADMKKLPGDRVVRFEDEDAAKGSEARSAPPQPDVASPLSPPLERAAHIPLLDGKGPASSSSGHKNGQSERKVYQSGSAGSPSFAEDKNTTSRGQSPEHKGLRVTVPHSYNGRPGSPGDDYGTFSPHSPHDSPFPEYAERGLHMGTGDEEKGDRDDGADGPSTVQPPVIFKERWRQKEARIRRQSKIGHMPGWRLIPVIVKSNDDLRQEQFASQLLRQIHQILRDANIPVWMRPYDIMATSFDGGLIEAIPDTVSLDALRRNDEGFTDLADFFERFFGQKSPQALAKAKRCFVDSMAAYSIICFLMQIKDRHNGNILIDAHGHVIHIDFGFMFQRSPGNVNFEKAPFKLTNEFVEVMDGPRSATFRRFRELCVKTYMELRRQRHKIILLVEMVMNGNESLACFGKNPQACVEALRQRFQPKLNDRACHDFVNSLIDQSLDNWRTRWYDKYQACWVGIA